MIRGLRKMDGSLKADRILIYRLGSLGDTVVSLPALRLIAKVFPNATRTMLTNFSISAKAAASSELLGHTDLVHQYIEYPLRLRNPMAFLSLRRRIRSTRPDLLIYLTAPRGRVKMIRDALFFRACGIRKLVGIPYSADKQSRRRLSDGLYEYEGARLLRCLENLGRQDLGASDAFDLALNSAEHDLAGSLLMPLGGAPIIALSIGAKADVKDWGDDNWRLLVTRLGASLPGLALILIGAPVERERSASLAVLWPGPSLNLCGDLSVRGSAAVLSRAKLYVGHDSGPMHLAAAVGTPCIAIFSSQNLPGEWFPQGAKHKVLYHWIECQGCRLTVCAKHDKACIRSISVTEVSDAVMSCFTPPVADRVLG